MGRPKKWRWVQMPPRATHFRPWGCPWRKGNEIFLTLEEHEAVRLADLEGLEQEEAARQMNISRPTFSRLLASARQKMADALINAKELRIEGGNYIMVTRKFRCAACGHTWEEPYGTGRPMYCPKCQTTTIYRIDAGRGMGGRGGRGPGGGGPNRGGGPGGPPR